MNVFSDLTQLVGNTPLLQLCRIEKKYALQSKLLAKLEYLNPLGSVKDRAACAMITAAERDGAICPGSIIVEPTSGNAGLSLAMVCAIRGYRLILTMPESVSRERRALLETMGVQIQLTPGEQGMPGAVERATQLCAEMPGAYMVRQFENPANSQIHRDTTAKEIWRDTQGQVDMLVAAFGTGGTITGVGSALRAQNPGIEIIGVEPEGSPVVSGGLPGPHKIQGIGCGFVPENLDTGLLTEVIGVSDRDAFETVRELARTEGLVVGLSSGAAVSAALTMARRKQNSGKTIVVILPDTGERYLNAGVFGFAKPV